MKARDILFEDFQPGDMTRYSILFQRLEYGQFLFGFAAGKGEVIPTCLLHDPYDICCFEDATSYFRNSKLCEWTRGAAVLVWLHLIGMIGQDEASESFFKADCLEHQILMRWNAAAQTGKHEPWQKQLDRWFGRPTTVHENTN